MKIRNLAIVAMMTIAVLTSCTKNSPSEVLSFSQFAALEASAVSENVDPNCGPECGKLRLEFRYIVYVGKQIYAYWDIKLRETGTDFDALAATIENSITNKTSDTEYFVAIRNWSAAFHDGHVGVIPRDDLSKFEIYTSPIRLQIYESATVNEKVFVSELKLSEFDVKIGDEVIAINGVPIREALDKVEDQSNGSTSRMRRARAASRLVDVLGVANSLKELSITLKREQAEISVRLPRLIDVLDSEKPAAPAATGANLIKSMVLPGEIGYLRIDGFTGSHIGALIDQQMNNLRATKALILDLRINGGGDASADYILARLSATDLVRYQVSPSLNPYVIGMRPGHFGLEEIPGTGFAQWTPKKVKANPNGNYAGKPVFALVSPRCFSACDTFVAALKSNKLAVILGEGTGGGTGTPLNFELPYSGHSFRYSVVRGKTAGGDDIEGVGTLPDVEILPNPQDLVSKKDSQLAATIEYVQKTVNPTLNNSEGLALQVRNTHGNIWGQGFEKSPSALELQELKVLSANDEL